MPYVVQTWCRAVKILVSSSFFEQMTFEQMTHLQRKKKNEINFIFYFEMISGQNILRFHLKLCMIKKWNSFAKKNFDLIKKNHFNYLSRKKSIHIQFLDFLHLHFKFQIFAVVKISNLSHHSKILVETWQVWKVLVDPNQIGLLLRGKDANTTDKTIKTSTTSSINSKIWNCIKLVTLLNEMLSEEKIQSFKVLIS